MEFLLYLFKIIANFFSNLVHGFHVGHLFGNQVIILNIKIFFSQEPEFYALLLCKLIFVSFSTYIAGYFRTVYVMLRDGINKKQFKYRKIYIIIVFFVCLILFCTLFYKLLYMYILRGL